MSIVESFSTGTPVLCSDLGNTGSIVIEGVNGVKFNGASEDSLIGAVKRLDNYPDIYETTMGDFNVKYREEINYNQLLKIYKCVKEKA